MGSHDVSLHHHVNEPTSRKHMFVTLKSHKTNPLIITLNLRSNQLLTNLNNFHIIINQGVNNILIINLNINSHKNKLKTFRDHITNNHKVLKKI